MLSIDFLNNVLKFFINNVFIYLISLKITNNNNNNKNIIIIIFLSGIYSLIYSISKYYISSIIILPILYFCYVINLSHITKYRWNYMSIVTIVSIVISYTLYLISILISSLIIKIIFNIENVKNSGIMLLAALIELFLLYSCSKLKRIKNGIYFLKNQEKLENIGVFAILFGGIMIITSGLFDYNRTTSFNTYLVSGTILIGISFIIWIQAEITKYYKEKMRNRTIELQKLEIDEHLKNIKNLKDNNLQLSTIIHKYNNRFSALENAIIKTLNQNNNTEFSSELTTMLDNLNTMSKDFSKEVLNNTNKCKNLPKTNIQSIDNIFEYMAEEAIRNNINFDLKINNSINYLIENIIDKSYFETLIGDHIKDAIIAINSSNNNYKSIMCILGIVNNCYEFTIYDTGIEFEIDTLLNLGLKYITTHKNTGGTGIGFITTFETLRKCKASLIIEEYSKETSNYTKCVIFRFDYKNEYRIHSYRAEEIKDKIKDNRIIVKKI